MLCLLTPLFHMLFCNKRITSSVHCCAKVERQAEPQQCVPTPVHRLGSAVWDWCRSSRAAAIPYCSNTPLHKYPTAVTPCCGNTLLRQYPAAVPAAAETACSAGQSLAQPHSTVALLAPGKSPAKGSESTVLPHGARLLNPQVSGGRGQPCLHFCIAHIAQWLRAVQSTEPLLPNQAARGCPPNIADELCRR